MSSIVQRGVRSFSWTAGAQIVVVGVGFARSVLLARMLNVETFGIYAGATAIVGLLAIPATLGLGGAFLHRAPETENEDRAAAVYLSMQVVASTVWLLFIAIGALFFASGPSRTAIIVIAITSAIESLSYPTLAIMNRRIVLQRMAKMQMVSTVVCAVVAVLLAWWGAELWALLAIELIGSAIGFVGFILWKPIWRPHFQVDRKIISYYSRFGIPYMFSNLAEYGLQKLDDLYVRFFLGVREMGFYSRAYTFANYPRLLMAAPVSAVAGSAFAELANDRLQLSKAFFRSCALIVRTSFLLGGLLVLVAPELVAVLLGEKWMPMVPLFRLFSIYTLIDPLRDILASIYVALGLPRRLLAYRLTQMIVLVAGLWLLGGRWGAEGVAVAVNLMLVTGIALMMRAVRPHVDFSVMRLFGTPLGALAAATSVSAALLWFGWAPENLLLRGIVKGVLFAAIYLSILATVERTEVFELLKFARRQLMRPPIETHGMEPNLAPVLLQDGGISDFGEELVQQVILSPIILDMEEAAVNAESAAPAPSSQSVNLQPPDEDNALK